MITSATTHTALGASSALGDRVDVAGGRAAVEVIGHGSPVVLTHGTPSWSYLWRNIATRLGEDHTVYLWDLLGYGDSTVAAGTRPSVALHAATLAELVEHWGLTGPRSAALVGHDIGGGAVLRAHLLHQVPARALMLLDAALLTPWVTPVAAHMQAHLEAYRTMPTSVFSEVIAAHVATTTARPMPVEVTRAYLDRYAGNAGQQRWLDQVAGFSDDDTRDVVAGLDQITAPTHVIWGERDQWLPLDTAERLRDAIPGAELTTIPDAGHFLTEDAPEATTTALHNALTAARHAES